MDYYFSKEKSISILKKIRSNLIESKSILEKAFALDKKEWEYEVKFDKFINSIDDLIQNKEYLPVISKEKIVDGYGKILLYSNKQNPYLIFNFIISCIYTNNKVHVALFKKHLAINKTIIEVIMKTFQELGYEDENVVDYIQLKEINNIIFLQDEFDLIYYFGNKKEYIEFTKRLHIDSKFENYGEIYVFVDNAKYKQEVVNLNTYAIENEISLKTYSGNLEDSVETINDSNNINKISVIYTDNLEKAYEFIRKIKSENVYINLKDISDIDNTVNLKKLVYRKKINLKK